MTRRATRRPVRNYYDDPNFYKYLSDSIITYKGQPCWGTVERDDDGFVKLTLLSPQRGAPNKIIGSIDLDDPDLDISSPVIGYCNYIYENEIKVVYLRRKPAQSWKQGLTGNNLSVYTVSGSSFHGYSSNHVIGNKGFLDSLTGVFPDLHSAMALLQKGKVKEIAVSRDLAFTISKTGVVLAFYKTEEFATSLDGGRSFMAKNSFKNRVICKHCPDLPVQFVRD